MPYAKSSRALIPVVEYLEAIEQQGECKFASTNPRRLAYLLHQAFVAAAELDHPRWGTFRRRFRVKEYRDSVGVERKVEDVVILSAGVKTSVANADPGEAGPHVVNEPRSQATEPTPLKRITNKHSLLEILSTIAGSSEDLLIESDFSDPTSKKVLAIRTFAENNPQLELTLLPDSLTVRRRL